MALLIVRHAWSWSLLVVDHPVIAEQEESVQYVTKTYTASQLTLEIELLIWKGPM